MLSRYLSLIIGPLIFILSLFAASDFYIVLGLGIWMLIWWVSEVVPIPVTSLLPIIALPVSGLFSVSEATAPYASPIIFLFMGGFMIALALERHKLHLRIALNILKLTGTSGNGIILGFIIATAALSMWISNTATAVMMLPVAASVIQLLNKEEKEGSVSYKNFSLSLMLSIAYAANIGGAMTLIGTPPNVVLAGYAKQILGIDLSFANWLMLGLAFGIPMLMICHILLTRVLFPNRIENLRGSEQMMDSRLNELGSISANEKKVIGIFLFTAILWVFKKQFNTVLGVDLLNDATTAMTGGILMFVMPTKLKEMQFLLSWHDTQKLPWGILLLFGGGMTLALALERVGIIEVVGDWSKNIDLSSIYLFTLFITILVLFLTEIMSNVALVTVFIPVAIGIAQGMNINELDLIIPAALASSCAFMMPISTPPNAIVFSSGHIKMKEMMRAGIVLNILAAFIISIFGSLLIGFLF